jgi:RNA polymerase sigma factor (sigma-70 family)
VSEQELVARAQAGDQEAFAQLVQANEKRIYNLTLRMTGNPDDGAELAQEAFLNAWRGLPRFVGGSSFSTWLYRLASNVCIDFLRREKRRRSISMTVSLDDEEDGRQAELPDLRFSPEELLEQKDLRASLQQGLEALSQEHRQVLVMRELEGLSYAEIAQVLDLEEGTVKSRIARARMSLRKHLIAQGNFFSLQSSIQTNAKGRGEPSNGSL